MLRLSAPILLLVADSGLLTSTLRMLPISTVTSADKASSKELARDIVVVNLARVRLEKIALKVGGKAQSTVTHHHLELL